MIEASDALATWRLERRPGPDDTESIRAERIGDHRRVYLEYEGPISGDRGVVVRDDHGAVNVLRDDASVWEVELRGAVLRGRYRLEACGDQGWRFGRA